MLRCELADWIRHAPFFLEFVSPFLKPLARPFGPEDPKTLDEVEEMIEAKYLKNCDLQIPLHFMSSCMSKALAGKWRLGEAIVPRTTSLPSSSRSKAVDNAIRMIELDSLIQSCPLTKGYLWFANFNFPFPGYVFLVQELRRSTIGPLVDRAWEAIAVNFKERNLVGLAGRSKLYEIISGLLVKAWEAREVALEGVDGQPLHLTEPSFITEIRVTLGKERKVNEQLQALSLTSPPIPFMQTVQQVGLDSNFYPAGGQGMGFADLGMNMGMEGLGGDQLGIWNMDFNMIGDVGDGNALFPGMQDMGTGVLGSW